MAVFLHRTLIALSIALLAIFGMAPVHGQSRGSCTSSMVSSFTPCLNFVTSSSSSGSSPTAACCSSLKSLTSNGTDCFCQILTGNMPFQIPINRTLAVALPRACKMSGVPLQCKTTVAPIPAPGPIALSPVLSPGAPSSIPGSESPALAPDADTDTDDLTPTGNSGIRPVLTPSAAQPSHSFSTSLVFALVGVITYNYCY